MPCALLNLLSGQIKFSCEFDSCSIYCFANIFHLDVLSFSANICTNICNLLTYKIVICLYLLHNNFCRNFSSQRVQMNEKINENKMTDHFHLNDNCIQLFLLGYKILAYKMFPSNYQGARNNFGKFVERKVEIKTRRRLNSIQLSFLSKDERNSDTVLLVLQKLLSTGLL